MSLFVRHKSTLTEYERYVRSGVANLISGDIRLEKKSFMFFFKSITGRLLVEVSILPSCGFRNKCPGFSVENNEAELSGSVLSRGDLYDEE